MKTFLCVVLLAACALAAPKPGFGYSGLSSYTLGSSYIDHAPIVYSSPAIVHEPTIVSVKKVVSVPRVVSVRKLVSVPRVVSAPYVSYSSLHAPSYAAGWW